VVALSLLGVLSVPMARRVTLRAAGANALA